MQRDRFQTEFVAALLRSERVAIAARAGRLLAERGTLGKWGGEARTAWQQSLEARVEELAASIAAERPADMAAQAAWARTAFEARGLPADDLIESLQALGLAAAEAVPTEDAGLVTGVMQGAIHEASVRRGAPPAVLSVHGPLGELAARYLLGLLEGDRLRAAEAVVGAVRAGLVSVQDVYTQVLCPVLREVGRMWHLGEVNVAEEHFATVTTQMVMAQLGPLAPRKASNGRAMLAGTAAGNLHEIGVRMVADRFEWEGWRVVYLGPSVPAEDLAQASVDFGVDVVALSATLGVQLDALEGAIAAVRAARADLCIVVGGEGLSGDAALAERLGADGYARGPAGAVEFVEHWLGRR